jgi:hypothetical protein
MNTPQSPEAMYSATFAGMPAPESKATKALAIALDIRKFEIELYWKRATYFWVFTGAALAAYLAALTGNDLTNRAEALLLTSCIGFVFALAWYFVNRASKFWQSNWEAHVDLLENEVNGPAYKTVITGPAPWWKPQGPYPFSVSKINQLLSLFVVAIFMLLVANTLQEHYVLSREWSGFPTACVAITIACVVLLVWLGRTGKPTAAVSMQLRKTSIKTYQKHDS